MDSNKIFSLFETIAGISGASKKQQFLCPEMKPYLKAAYDPFQQYYAKRMEVEAKASDPNGGVFDDDVWYLLEKLRMRHVSGLVAQDLIGQTIRNLAPPSAALFIRILNKDLRIGLRAKSINKVFPGLIPTHDIMLAKLFDPTKVSFPCWAGPKIDGVRGVFRRGHFYSRAGHQFVGLEHLEEQLSDFTEPIDGELIVPDVSFQVSSGRIRSDASTPDAQFYMFELPSIRMPFPDRLEMMSHLYDIGPDIRLVEHLEMVDFNMLYEFYGSCRANGFEGAIVRPYDYHYVGTRSYSWMKMKPKMRDLELKVVNLYEGNGKYEGLLGGVIVEYHSSKGLRKVRVGGGFTDDQREFYWNCPSAIMYKYIQAEAMEETDDGSLRHPIFKEVKD